MLRAFFFVRPAWAPRFPRPLFAQPVTVQQWAGFVGIHTLTQYDPAVLSPVRNFAAVTRSHSSLSGPLSQLRPLLR